MNGPNKRMPQPPCGASSIATAGGPTAVPFRLCCAQSIIQTSGNNAGPRWCDALDAGSVRARPGAATLGTAP
jgi:hypothetical protein